MSVRGTWCGRQYVIDKRNVPGKARFLLVDSGEMDTHFLLADAGEGKVLCSTVGLYLTPAETRKFAKALLKLADMAEGKQK